MVDRLVAVKFSRKSKMLIHVPFRFLLEKPCSAYALAWFKDKGVRDLGASDDGDSSDGDDTKFCGIKEPGLGKHGWYSGDECPICKSNRLGRTFDNIADRTSYPPNFQWPNCDCPCGCGRGRHQGISASPAGGRCTNCIQFCP